MTTELARTTDVNLDELQRMATIMVASGYFDAAREQRQAVAQMSIKIMAGREMGYGPFASVQGIHVISGKPSLSANLMAAAVKGHPRYDYRVRKMDNDGVVIEFFENGESLGKSEFTADDAKKAGTQNMNKFARNMMFARALSNGVRWYCPDVFNGNAVYSPEELGASVDDNGDVIDVPFVEQRPAEPQHRNGTQAAAPQPEPTQQPPTSLDELPEMNPEPNKPAQQGDTQPAEYPADWRGPVDAQMWAVTFGHCANDHEARNSWLNTVKEHKGFDKTKAPQVYAAFYAKHMTRAQTKKQLEPAGPDVGDGENMPMAA